MNKSALSLLIFFAVLFTLNVKAETSKEIPQTLIAFAGVKDNGIAFDISWTDADGTTEIIIKDKSGNVVYKESFKDSRFKKRFILSKEESEQFTFILSNGKKRLEKTFLISTSMVEKIIVNELK